MSKFIIKQAGIPAYLEELISKNYHLVDITKDESSINKDVYKEAEILVTNGETFVDLNTINKFPALKLIANFGVGYDRIDVNAAIKKGILVSNTPDVLTEDVADLAVGLLLSLSRAIPRADNFVKQGLWEKNGMGSFPWTYKVSGSSVGIVGMGRIGKAIAKRMAAFDVKVGYYSHKPIDQYIHYDSLEKLAVDSDFLIVAVPGVAANYHLINDKVIDALGPEGSLINIARGNVVDEKYLTQALIDAKIRGAALDVFENEPFVGAKLRSLNNVVLTPHMASATYQTREAMCKLVFDNIEHFHLDGKLLTPIPECK